MCEVKTSVGLPCRVLSAVWLSTLGIYVDMISVMPDGVNVQSTLVHEVSRNHDLLYICSFSSILPEEVSTDTNILMFHVRLVLQNRKIIDA